MHFNVHVWAINVNSYAKANTRLCKRSFQVTINVHENLLGSLNPESNRPQKFFLLNCQILYIFSEFS